MQIRMLPAKKSFSERIAAYGSALSVGCQGCGLELLCNKSRVRGSIAVADFV
jgi:hypothetical protein